MLLIKNGLVFTMENEEPEYSDILIKNQKIEKIGENIYKVVKKDTFTQC